MRPIWILAAVSLLTLAACSDNAQQPQPNVAAEGEARLTLPPPREEPPPSANRAKVLAPPPSPGPPEVVEAMQLPPGTPLENERPIGPQDVVPRGAASIGYERSPTGQMTPYVRMQDGRIVRTTQRAAVAPFSSPPAEFVPLPLVEPDAKLPIPGPVDDVVVGGGGRYLLLAMHDLQKVVVFDVREGKVLKYVNVESDEFFVAGGATQFVIADAKENSLEAWNYERLEQPRLRADLDPTNKKKLAGAVMGFSSQGPLGCSFKYEKYGPQQAYVELFDLETLKPLKYVVDWNGRYSFSPREPGRYRLAATPDGRSFLMCEGSNVNTLKLNADGSIATLLPATRITSSISTEGPPPPALEGPAFFDKTSILLGEGRRNSPTWKLGASMRQISPALPGHYWLMSGNASYGNLSGLVVAFYFTEVSNPLAAMRLNIPTANQAVGAGRLPGWKRLFYNAAEKTLVVLPLGVQEIYIKRFDLDEAVAKSETSVLQVVSQPPSEFFPGKKFEYAIRAVSNRGGLSFRLEAGPTGMTVSPKGLVEWQAPADAPEKQTAIIALSDETGQQMFHNVALARGEVPLQGVAFGSNAPIDSQSPRVGLKLPGPFSDVVVGAGGAYLLAPMPSVRQIAVIDVKQRKIVKLIPADDEIVKIAAGATRFVIYSGKGALSRWNYARLERELTIPFEGQVDSLCMGSASEGPILLSRPKTKRSKSVFLDLNTLKPTNIKVWLPAIGVEGNIEGHVAASANGQTFTSWRNDTSSIGMFSYVVRGEEAWVTKRYASGGPVTPSPDGSVIYTLLGAHPSFSTNGSDLDDLRRKTFGMPPYLKMPAATGNYYLRWSSSPDGNADDARAVTLHVQGNETPVMTIPGVGPPFQMPKKFDDPDPLYPRRVLYLPVVDTVMALSATMDSIIFHRFVLDEALAKLPTNYLFVASAPPSEVRPSTQLRYQVEVKSRQGGVKYTLAGGPAGARISPTGLVTWNVSASVTGKHPFAVHIRDESGAETAHIFTVQVEKSAPATGSATLAATTVGNVPPAIAPPTTPPPNVAAVVRPRTAIKLPGPVSQLCVGGGGRYLIGFIKASQQVAVIDVRERQLQKLIPADDEEVRIAAGATKFVVLQVTRGVFSRYALATCERELTAVAPDRQKIATLSMGCESEGPIIATTRGRLNDHPIFFDLMSLKPSAISLGEDARHSFGSDVAVSADGRLFMAGNVQCRIVDLKVETSRREGFGFGVPSSDGRILYGAGDLWHVDGNRIGPGEGPGFNIPALVGPYFVRVPSVYVGDKPSASRLREKPLPAPPTLHLQGDNQTILTMADVEFSPIPRDSNRMPIKIASERFFLLPTADAMATLSPNEDQILIYRFHFEEELAKIEGDYLLVVSQPPLAVHPESRVEYQLDVRSKRGGVKYRLENGPAGMTISPSGLISWSPQLTDREEQVVIAAVSDASGQELFHTFRLKLDVTAPQTPAVGTTIPKASSAPEIRPRTTPPQTASVAPTPTATPPASTPTAMPTVTAVEAVPGDRVKHLLKLPATIDDVCVGGAGRYLVAQLTTLRQAAIIDVLEKRVVKILLIDDEKFCLAAGSTKLVVALMSKNILARYDLATGARELTVVHSGKPIRTLAMGSASEGPLFVGESMKFEMTPRFLRLSTLKPADIDLKQPGMRFGTTVRAGANGALFGSWTRGLSPTGLHLLRIDGTSALYFHEHESVGMVLPSPDARIVYTGAGMYTPDAKTLNGLPNSFTPSAVMLPAATGTLYLQWKVPFEPHLRPGAEAPPLTLHVQGEKSPLLTLQEIDLPKPSDDPNAKRHPMSELDKQILLLPAAEALVTIPQSSDQITIHRFQLDEELHREESAPLFVASVPPSAVKPGADFQYQVVAKSKRGGLKYRLESGPAGMTVSPTGLVTWKAVRVGEPEVIGIIAVSDDSGEEIFHTFRLRLDADAPTAPPTTASRPMPSPTGTRRLPAASASLRTWKSVDGMFTVEARFEKLADGKVTLLRVDGKRTDVPLEKLSQEDRDFVAEASKAAP
ncbi:MAG: hypothetical protein C0483_07375 [Pirellula sp.]|nr:hypothetical protein [Pirellula sp.]